MTGQRRPKVAPRRSWHSIKKLLIHSRVLHSTLATMEQQDKIAQMPRVRSPKQRAIEIQEAPQAVPAVKKALAKPLMFRKTKRELEKEKERQDCEQLPNKRRVQEVKTRVCVTMQRVRPKCARMLE